jgi:hypothetical protein
VRENKQAIKFEIDLCRSLGVENVYIWSRRRQGRRFLSPIAARTKTHAENFIAWLGSNDEYSPKASSNETLCVDSMLL